MERMRNSACEQLPSYWLQEHIWVFRVQRYVTSLQGFTCFIIVVSPKSLSARSRRGDLCPIHRCHQRWNGRLLDLHSEGRPVFVPSLQHE